MRHNTAGHHSRGNGNVSHQHGLGKKLHRIKGSITHAAGKITGKTSQVLNKSLEDVKYRTKKLPKEIDRIVIKKRYQTIGAAMVAGLCIGYFIRK